jgi:5-methylthioribose kinase
MCTEAEPRTDQRQWLLQGLVTIWEGFVAEFTKLWTCAAATGGAACPPQLFGPNARSGPAALVAFQAAFFKELWGDVLGFAGACMIRRLVAIAHVADMDSIADPETRWELNSEHIDVHYDNGHVTDVIVNRVCCCVCECRAACERQALRFGRELMVSGAQRFSNLTQVVQAAMDADT